MTVSEEKKVITLDTLAIVIEKIKADYITVDAATQQIEDLVGTVVDEAVHEAIDDTINYATDEDVLALFEDENGEAEAEAA